MKTFSKTAIVFGIVHLLLAVTVVGTYRLAFADSDSDSPKWLHTVAGTLSFPTLAYADVDTSPESPALIEFRWWNRSPVDLPWQAWATNIALWSIILTWIWFTVTRTTPNRVVAVAAILLIILLNALCYSLFVTIEYSAQWRDFIAVFGTLATLLAFVVAIKQIGDAKRAAEAARDAATATASDYEQHYFWFSIAKAQQFFALVRHNVSRARGNAQLTHDWIFAAEYLTLPAEVLEHAHKSCRSEDAESFETLREDLRSTAHECQRMAAGGQKFRKSDWDALDKKFTRLTLAYLSPLPVEV